MKIIPILTLGIFANACSEAFLGITEDDLILKGKRERVLYSEDNLKSNTTDKLKPLPVVANTQWTQTSFNLKNSKGNFAGNSKPVYDTRLQIGNGSSNSGALTASPIIANGKLFAMDAQAKVSAYDIKDAYKKIFDVQLRYKKEDLEEGYGGGIVYSKGNLIATTGYGVVYNLNATNGKEKWSNFLKRPIRAHPKVFKDSVFVIDVDNTLHNISLKTGKHKWKFEGIPGTTGVLNNSKVAIYNNTIFIPLNTGEIIALGMDGKTVKWTIALVDYENFNLSDSNINAISDTVVIHQNKLFASSHSGFLGSFDINTGKELWSVPIKSVSAPTIIGNYIVSTNLDDELYAVNINTGKIKWVLSLANSDDHKDARWLRPLMVNNKLIVISTHGVLLTIEPRVGKITRRYKLNEDVFIPPIIVDKKIYVFTDDAEMFILK